MRKTLAIFLVPIIALFGLILTPVNAQGESGSDTIHEDYYVAHPIYFLSGDYITISYTMRVIQGPKIDVYFVDSQNYKYYQDGRSFDYYIEMSDENTMYASNQITLNRHDIYYLIFDNTDIGTDPPWNMIDDVAYVSWTINYDIHYNSEFANEREQTHLLWLAFLIVLVIVAIFIIIIALIVWDARRKKAN